MAPEQAEGRTGGRARRPTSTRLGAILYELPHRPAAVPGGDGPGDARAGAGRRAGAAAPAAAAACPRDLETICLKCLEKEPAGGTPSAEALADDLARHLRGEPILARRPAGLERAWKWARREPAAAAFASALALTVVLAFASTTWPVGAVRRGRRPAGRRGRPLPRRGRPGAARPGGRPARPGLGEARLLPAAGVGVALPEAAGVTECRSWPDTLPPANAIAIAPGGRTLASAGQDGSLTAVDVATAVVIWRTAAHAGQARGVAFHPDGGRVATCGDDGAVLVWDLAARRCLERFDPGGRRALAVAFSPDGPPARLGQGRRRGPDPRPRRWTVAAARAGGAQWRGAAWRSAQTACGSPAGDVQGGEVLCVSDGRLGASWRGTPGK